MRTRTPERGRATGVARSSDRAAAARRGVALMAAALALGALASACGSSASPDRGERLAARSMPEATAKLDRLTVVGAQLYDCLEAGGTSASCPMAKDADDTAVDAFHALRGVRDNTTDVACRTATAALVEDVGVWQTRLVTWLRRTDPGPWPPRYELATVMREDVAFRAACAALVA